MPIHALVEIVTIFHDACLKRDPHLTIKRTQKGNNANAYPPCVLTSQKFAALEYDALWESPLLSALYAHFCASTSGHPAAWSSTSHHGSRLTESPLINTGWSESRLMVASDLSVSCVHLKRTRNKVVLWCVYEIENSSCLHLKMATDFKISGAINSIAILLANHYDPNSLKEKKNPVYWRVQKAQTFCTKHRYSLILRSNWLRAVTESICHGRIKWWSNW